MRHRSRPDVRCSACFMRRDLCFCDCLTPVKTETKLILTVHKMETSKPTNTARLLHRLIPASELHVVGLPQQQTDISGSIPAGTVPLVLFPEPSSPILDASFVASLKAPVTLIVPDGTWKQARKMAHRLPALRGIPRVRLAPREPSTYILRRNQSEGGLCTLEAVAEALGVIEGELVRQQLRAYLSLLIERVLWSRRTSEVLNTDVLDKGFVSGG